MKLSSGLKVAALAYLAGAVSLPAATEEQLNKRFPAAAGGNLVVDVDFGSITVTTNSGTEVTVDVWRKVNRRKKADEETFLKDSPVEFVQDGSKFTVRSHGPKKINWNWSWNNRTEGKYTITVPARFDAHLVTAGGGIEVNDLEGKTKANTSGGSLHFARLRGPLDGNTSGGSIHLESCTGQLGINTSGGGIEVTGGGGTLKGNTSGGSIRVKGFNGPADVHTSGGSINVEGIAGAIDGSTSGGGIHAVLSSVKQAVRLETSGGSVSVQIPENAAFDLDAETSAGGVHTDLPVTVTGKIEHSRLKGPVNGGGQTVRLRTSGGGIEIKKLKAEL